VQGRLKRLWTKPKVAVDSSKLGGRAVAVGLEWEQIDVLVTELDPASERLAEFRDLAQIV
jgi:DeoR family transcriptional regulator, fructose operon transcriptional repressor